MDRNPQYIVVETQKTIILLKYAQSFEVFDACFYAICTEYGEYAVSCAVRCTATAAVHRIARACESCAVSHVLQAVGKLYR